MRDHVQFIQVTPRELQAHVERSVAAAVEVALEDVTHLIQHATRDLRVQKAWLTMADCAHYLDDAIQPATVRSNYLPIFRDQGEARKVGREWVIRRTAWEAYIESLPMK